MNLITTIQLRVVEIKNFKRKFKETKTVMYEK